MLVLASASIQLPAYFSKAVTPGDNVASLGPSRLICWRAQAAHKPKVSSATLRSAAQRHVLPTHRPQSPPTNEHPAACRPEGGPTAPFIRPTRLQRRLPPSRVAQGRLPGQHAIA